ncbi:MAG: transporter, partial [Acetobacteraceae bacterium]|nr:transporter [Acetobacteraceae bacterium]
MLLTVGATRAGAQEVEPYEFLPLPAGSNLLLGYWIYGHNTEFNFARGPTVKDSGLEVNLFVARYVHFTSVLGHPAGFEIVQPFGSLSGAHIDGQRVGSAFGAADTTLSAFIWPYSNPDIKTNVIVAGFYYPPSGTYDPLSPINVGDNIT